MVGKRDAQRAYQLCVGTFDKFEELVGRIGDARDRCGFERCPSLYLASNAEDGEHLKEEFRCRKEAGIELELLSEGEIRRRFGFSRPSALLSRVGAVVDPYRLNQKLLAAADQRGVAVFGKTHVVKYEPTSGGVRLVCENGPVVKCRRVVFATGYETPVFLDQDIVALKSTYAVASAPLARPVRTEKTLVWETSRPYFYVRWGEENRVLCGGEDEAFRAPKMRDELIGVKAQVLTKRFEEMFGVQMTPECAWAGTFGETKDGLPYIGPHQQFPNGYFALGYGGNGITFSLVAAEIIRDGLVGKRNEDERIFRFDR
jgi:glycine/D-amino acid oxidase-like deaminating enzyme